MSGRTGAGGTRVRGRTASVRRWMAAGGLLGLVAACAPAATRGGDVPESEIVRALELSAERWNAGDLEGFLEPYLDAPGTTYVGSAGVVRGKDSIAQLYRRSYWRDGRPEETLRFGALEVRPLGPDHALVLGRYFLFDHAGEPSGEGPFSLVFARTPAGWKIIHDHSS